MSEQLLTWRQQDGFQDAQLASNDDGVYFTLCRYPTCHRRGQWRLIVETRDPKFRWGCFDDADMPMRHYHSEATAKSEADAIAAAIFGDLFIKERLDA